MRARRAVKSASGVESGVKVEEVENSSIAAEARFLSPSDLDNLRKSPSKVKSCWIEKLGGYVYFRESSAKTMRDFFNLKSEDMPQSEVVNCLAQFAADVLCNEDGSDFISFETALTYSLETLDGICSGISEGLKGPKSKGKRGRKVGNASRR
jgi:hypothetical protein